MEDNRKFVDSSRSYDEDNAPILRADEEVVEVGCVDFDLSAKPLGCSSEIDTDFEGKTAHAILFLSNFDQCLQFS